MKRLRWSPPYDFLYLVEGKPEKDHGGLLSTDGKRKYDIIAYRCEQCGLMKFYVEPESPRKK